jgi:hypothetical protein
MLVSAASGVSTKMSLCFQTSFKIPYKDRRRPNQPNQPISSVSPSLQPLKKRGEGRRRERGRTNHIVPSRNDALHVEITREERDDSIGNALRVLYEDGAKVSHDGGVVSDFEPGGDGDLVRASGDDLPGRTARERKEKVR